MRLSKLSFSNLAKINGSVSCLVDELRRKGLKIVLTSGSYDLFHVGHAQYLNKAKDCGDVLIVGLDSDEKIKKRKGPDRPIVSEEERAAILSFVRPVDFIIIKDVEDEPMGLIKTIKPDVLVVSETTKHDEKKLGKMLHFCESVVILEAQSTTSTTAKVRRLFVDGAGKFAKDLTPQIENLIQEALHNFQKEGK